MDPKTWDWIQEFEKADEPYKSFYEKDNHHVKIHFIYMNAQQEKEQEKEKEKEQEIQEEKEILFFLQEKNTLSEDEILTLFETHSFYKNKRYTLQSIYVYHFDMTPMEILDERSRFRSRSIKLKRIPPNHSISLHRTIEYFQDLNEIFFFLQEKEKKPTTTSTHNSTRKNK